MNDFYLHLYCGDSLEKHVDSHAGDFLVDLPRTYVLEGQWECALTELTFVSDFEKLINRIYVCSDLVVQSYARGTSLPILRPVDITENEKNVLVFNPAYYLRIHRQAFNRIRIFIRDEELNPCRFKIDRLYCTLHFRNGFHRNI